MGMRRAGGCCATAGDGSSQKPRDPTAPHGKQFSWVSPETLHSNSQFAGAHCSCRVVERTKQSYKCAMLRFFVHAIIVLGLTALTQIGGIAWLVAIFFRHRAIAFIVFYAALTVASILVAPTFGRVPLNCFDTGKLQVQSWMYCALNRHYVAPDIADILVDTAQEMDKRFPGAVTVVLDANFPFLDGFPLLPHLSHDDGDKVDLAFFYQSSSGYLPAATRSPIGYFAFEQGPSDCSKHRPTLRWDFGLLQPLWRDYALDLPRNSAVLEILSGDERVGKIFVEPHLVQTLNAAHPKIRFQGCRAARHDDHIHFQLK